MINTQIAQRLIGAAVLAAGVFGSAVAASAQTAPAAAPTTTTTANATNVSMTTINPRSDKQARLDAINADARRIEFRFLGTSL